MSAPVTQDDLFKIMREYEDRLRRLEDQGRAAVPSGFMGYTASPITPAGWLPMDGTSYLRNSYPDLFDALCPRVNEFTTVVGAGDLVFPVAHGLAVNEPVIMTTTGVLPSTFSIGALYYVRTVVNSTTIRVSATPGGTEITTGSGQSGIHTMRRCPWGMSGSTTFYVPETRGRIIIGAGSGAGTTTGAAYGLRGIRPFGTALVNKNLGEWGGEEKHLLLQSEMAAHTHASNSSSVSGSVGGSDGGHAHTGTTDNTNVDHYHSLGSGAYAWGAAFYTVSSGSGASFYGLAQPQNNITANASGGQIHSHGGGSLTGGGHGHGFSLTAAAQTINNMTGGDNAHNVLNPWIAGNPIIKT